LIRRGELDRHPFWSPEPCPETAADRVARIQTAFDAAPGVRREFSAPGVVIYRMD